jgi:hypothetical protein
VPDWLYATSPGFVTRDDDDDEEEGEPQEKESDEVENSEVSPAHDIERESPQLETVIASLQEQSDRDESSTKALQQETLPMKNSAEPIELPLDTPAGARAFLEGARDQPLSYFLSNEETLRGSVKLVFLQEQVGWPPIELAYAYVFHIPEVGTQLCMDRLPNDRLRVVYRVMKIQHIVVVNMPQSHQTVWAFLEPIASDARA